MSSKKQFLDPICASCKLILLSFSDPNTKIRIADHTIKLTDDTYSEKLLFRPWIFHDSREDMAALYPMIVRFIELYLIEKNNHIAHSENKYTDKCYEYLKKLAEYMIVGMSKLIETYGISNATFTLQYYCNLLRSGIDGTYCQEMLPSKLRDFNSNNLLNSDKIKNLWKDDDIISVGELFEKCFNAYKEQNTQMLGAYGAAITAILESRDKDFRNKITDTECA